MTIDVDSIATQQKKNNEGIVSYTDKILDVFVIGAGFSGVCAGIKLLESGIDNFQIFEKADDIGGTWHDNQYPGAACDVPSHLYCFSFEMNPDWSRVYSPQQEIKDYIKMCAEKYKLLPHIKLNKKIKSLTFLENHNFWRIDVDDTQPVYARHIVNGSGGLHEPLIPDFVGQKDYTGISMHTARWDKKIDLKNKTISVIGSAASAIQAIPELAKVAAQLKIFQRTPNYIAPRKDRLYSQKWKTRFRKFPWVLSLYRIFIFYRMEYFLFPVTKRNSRFGKILEQQIKKYPKAVIQDSELVKKMIPNFRLGCKRILVSDNFYQALNKPNVAVITEAIERFDGKDIITSDTKRHDSDIIIYATGFDIEKHQFSIDVYGVNGRSLKQEWADIPTAYKGVSIAGFPNLYLMTGPNTGVGTTSVVYMIEQQIDLVMRLIKAAGNDKLIDIRNDAQKRYNEKIQSGLSKTVWASGCMSWYKRADGAITTLYPYNARSYRDQQKSTDLSDYKISPFQR